MNSRIKYGCIISIMIMLFSWSFTILGAENTMIKVGLESVYKNASSISLKSDSQIELGYLDVEGFIPIGILNQSNITITSLSSNYYDLGVYYSTYQEAYNMALDVQGVPAYLDYGIFAVYTTLPIGNAVLNNGKTYVVSDENGQVIFIFNKATMEIGFRGFDFSSGMNLTGVGNSKKYRGAIGIAGTTGLTPYNYIPIEEYLYGVVPCEMSPSWPEEALKAQAVAARSLAIYQFNRYVSSGYNVVDTTATQAYGGYTKEDSRSQLAVDVTRGQTIMYNGKVAEALYFSTSGGVTESAENVWGYPIPYLVSVEDIFETEPAQKEWVRNITLDEINTCLAKNKVDIGLAQGVQILGRTESGRVSEMTIIGTKGNHTISKENIRTFFSGSKEGSLKSRLFRLVGADTNESVQQNTVSILSADEQVEWPVQDLIVTNGQLTMPIEENSVMIESDSAVVEVPFVSSMPSGGSQGVETIMGDITIVGNGYGHGVGMSQSGAKGMAMAGYKYDEILKYYFRGVTVE